MEGHEFDESEFFAAIAASGARALLIGRRALVALGLPVLTHDYDFWLAADDLGTFNRALSSLGFTPSHTPEEARARGRYVLENSEHVDVLVARAVGTIDGQRVVFEELWSRRRAVPLSGGSSIYVPTIRDLIDTKRLSARPKDAEDVRLLRLLAEEEGE